MRYLLHLVVYFNVFAILALSLNILVGYCGLLSLAHAGYFAIGAYTYALLTVTLGMGFVPATLAGVTLAGLLSLAISLPAWRLRGNFFIMATLAVQALLYSAIYNWHSPTDPPGTWKNLTNGPFGIPAIPRAEIAGIQFATLGGTAVLSVGVAAACFGVAWVLLRSPWGRVLTTIRDDELAARSLGKNTRRLKVEAIAIGCGMAAAAGATYSSYVSYVDPGLASLDMSILLLSMVIVGGVGNFRGPLVGAAVLLAIPEVLRSLHIPAAMAADLRLMAYGLLLLLMMHFRPQGLAGRYRIE